MTLTRRKFLSSSVIIGSSLMLPKITQAAAGQGHIIVGYENLANGPVGQVVNQINAVLSDYYKAYQYSFDEVIGNNTIKSMVEAKEGPADGSQILFAFAPQIDIFPEIYRKLPYDPLTDFKPLVLLGGYTFLITVGPAVDKSVQTIDDYAKWVDDNPEYRNIGFAQYGSSGHVTMLMLARGKNIALRPQAYRSLPQLGADLADGNLAAGIVLTGFNRKLYENGTLRAIGTTSQFRHPGYHDIPTCREQGLNDIDISGWFGLFINAQTPEDRYNKLMYAYQNSVTRGDYLKVLQQNLFKPIFDSPEQITARIQKERQFYRNIIQEYRISRL